MKNSADQWRCYPQWPKAEVDISLALLFIQNISPFVKEFRHFTLCFPLTKNNTISFPGFLSHQLNNLQRAALLKSLVQYDKDLFKFRQQQELVMVNYACGFNQSETG